MQGNVAAVPSHDLHEGDLVVGLHGVAQGVDGPQHVVDGGIEADGGVGVGEIVVDGAGHADDTEVGERRQVGRAVERAVAADDDKAVDLVSVQHGGGLQHSLFGGEFLTAGGLQDRAAGLDDVGDGTPVHLENIIFIDALISSADAQHLRALREGTAHHGAHAGIHAGGVAPAGQNGNSHGFRILSV